MRRRASSSFTVLTGSPSGTSAAPATSFSLIVLTPVNAMSQRRVRGPSFTGMTSSMAGAHSTWCAGSARHVSDDASGCVGSGSPDGRTRTYRSAPRKRQRNAAARRARADRSARGPSRWAPPRREGIPRSCRAPGRAPPRGRTCPRRTSVRVADRAARPWRSCPSRPPGRSPRRSCCSRRADRERRTGPHRAARPRGSCRSPSRSPWAIAVHPPRGS